MSKFQIGDTYGLVSRKRDLLRHKRVATGLLVLMALIFSATFVVPEAGFCTRLIRTASEAGIVGGLADWFAVTALFRHPLGIPIPHTALIPHNKERIGENLGDFFARHFLTEQEVLRKLRTTDVAGYIGQWFAHERNAAFFADYVSGAVPYLLDSFNDAEIRRLIISTTRKQLEDLELAPTLARMLALVVQNDQHRKLLDQTLDYVRTVLLDNRDELDRLVREQSRWWVPRHIDREMARLIVDATVQLLDELADKEHETRRRFDAAAAELIDGLEHSPVFQARVDEIRRSLIENAELHALFGDVWTKLKESITDQVSTPSSQLRRIVIESLSGFGRRVATDDALRQRMNRHIKNLVVQFVVPWRAGIGQFIAEVVRQWDTEALSEQIEIEVGRDLQFIRVNGTLVGSLVGAVLFLLTLGLG